MTSQSNMNILRESIKCISPVRLTPDNLDKIVATYLKPTEQRTLDQIIKDFFK